MLQTSCPSCHTKKNFRPESIGTVARCQACGEKFLLPEAKAPPLQPVASVLAGCLVLGGCCVGSVFSLNWLLSPSNHHPSAEQAKHMEAAPPSPTSREERRVEPHDDMTLFLSKYGPPDEEVRTENEKPRPQIVTRWLIYKPENVRAVYRADVPPGTPPPYENWKLFGFQNSTTNEVMEPADVVALLSHRGSRASRVKQGTGMAVVESPAPATIPATPPAKVESPQEQAAREARDRERDQAARREAERASLEEGRREAAQNASAMESQAAQKLKAVHLLIEDSSQARRDGNPQEAKRLEQLAAQRIKVILRDFPDTPSAAEAKSLLDILGP